MAPKLKIAGLYTNSNPHSAIPPGALTEADNCVIRSKDQLEPRRGMGADSNAIATTGLTQNALAFYDSGRIAQYLSAGGSQKLAYSTGGAWTSHSATFIPPDITLLRMKFAEASQNLYFNTSLGVKRITSLAITPAASGLPAPACYDTTALATGSGLAGAPNATGSFLPVNSAVAYRVVHGARDVNGNLILSAPSDRIVISNPANATVAAGLLVRTLTTTVTATVSSHSFKVGMLVYFTEAAEVGPTAFATGLAAGHTITAVTPTTFTYLEGGANGPSAAIKTFSSGTKQVFVEALLDPSASVIGAFYRIYRTLTTATAGADPGDEMYQIYEKVVTSTVASMTDTTPESSLFSNPLYTNPKSGDGIGSANVQPPFCKDLTAWQQRMWFANTSHKQRYTFQIVGCGTPDGVQAGDIISIGDLTLRWYDISGGAVSADHWDIAFTTALTPAQNIEFSARSLVSVLNYNWGISGLSTLRASYISNQGEAPGKILIESASYGASTFYVGSTRAASYSPVPPVSAVVANTSARVGTTVTVNTSTSHGFSTGDVIRLAASQPVAAFPVGAKTITVTSATQFTYTEAGSATSFPATTYVVHSQAQASDNDSKPHGVYYSKAQEPEAVPLLNYVTVGAKNKQILRIVPLREKLFVFKDDGLFTISGNAPFLQVDALDTTLRLVAPDSAVVLGNQIYCLTNQGVVTVSDSGVGVISFPIEQDILNRVALATNVRKSAFGISYDSDRMYILAIPANGSGTSCDKQWVYNYVTKAWTTWSLGGLAISADEVRHGGVDPLYDKLVWCGNSDYVVVERKSHTQADYYGDNSTSVTATRTGSDVNLSPVPSGYGPNDGLITNDGTFTTDYAVAPNEVVISNTAIADGAGTYYVHYNCTITFVRDALAMPGVAKQFKEIVLHFSAQNIRNLYPVIATEHASQTMSTVGTAPTLFPASVSFNPKNIRFLVPLSCQRGTSLAVGFITPSAGTYFRLDGYSIELEPTSQRVVR